MAGLFSSTEQDVLGNIVKERTAANTALGAPYGKYSGIVSTGGMLADIGADAAAGGATGAADPRMQKMKDAKRIFASVAMTVGNTSSPEFYEALSKELAANNYPEEATKAAEEASKKRSEGKKEKLTDLQIKEAEVKVSAAEQAAKDAADSLKTRTNAMNSLFPDASAEVKAAIAGDKELFKTTISEKFKVKDAQTQITTIGDRVKLVNKSTGAEIADLGPAPATAKTTVEVNLGDKGAAAYGAKVGGLVGEQDVALVNSATTAGENLPKIQDTLTLLKKGDPTTGIGADVINNINRVKAQFLADKKANKRVTDTQVLDALLGSEVFPMIGALGIGARGLDTPAEREFLRGVFTGTIQMNKETLIKLTETRMKIAERAVKKYNDMLDRGDLNNYQEAQGRKLRRIELPTQQPGMQTTSSGTSYQIVED